MNYKQLAEEYFESFNNQNLESLSLMCTDDVGLRDWDIELSSRSEMIEALKNIFKSVESININVLNLYNSGLTVIGEIEILINNTNKLLVVDVIDFNEEGKITSIRAYKG